MSSDPIEVLREVYWAGWLNASAWANRDDQLDDRGSHAYRKLEDEAVQPALASLSAPKRKKGNTPIGELLAQYEEEGCDHSNMVWVRAAAQRYVETMEDSQVRCLLHVLAAPKPEGEWVMVPREPTEAMADAFFASGHTRSLSETGHYTWQGDTGNFAFDYAAMLAAAPKPPSMNDNAVAVNESAPVNDKPGSAEAVAWCPACEGAGWSSDVMENFAPVTCPDCAGSGRAEHSITANESAPPRPEASESETVWSRTKPTHPGVYGVRGFNLGREPEDQFEAIVSVRLVDGELLCNLHESTSEDDFERWSRVVEDNSDSFEWCEFVPATAPQQASAPVGVPVDVVREYLDARACYEAATRPPNSHARAPVLKHDDPDALRLREARVALDNAIVLAQQPAADEKPVGWWNGILPDVTDRSPYDPSIRWGADAENSGHDIPLYAGVNPSRVQQPAAHPAITHCDNCGCDWIDNGLNPIGCPYCKQNAANATSVAVDEAWQVQLADALEFFWNAALGGVREHDDSTASAVMSGMVQGVAAVADRLREHAGQQQGGDS